MAIAIIAAMYLGGCGDPDAKLNTAELIEQASQSAASDDMERAFKLLDMAANRSPGDPMPWLIKGNILIDQQDYEGALAALDKAVEIAPGHAESHLGRALALRQLGRFDEARPVLRRAFDLYGQRYAEADTEVDESLKRRRQIDARIQQVVIGAMLGQKDASLLQLQMLARKYDDWDGLDFWTQVIEQGNIDAVLLAQTGR